MRPFLTPRWLGAHVLLIVVCAAMIRLGIWQWHVGGVRNGDLRNYAYAVQWWAFTGFAIFFWGRLIHDARRPVEDAQPPVADPPSRAQYRRYAMPQSDDVSATDDPERARYNAYLRSLDDT